MLLSCDTSQLLIVDVQAKLLPAMSDQRAIERCIRLVRAAKTLGVPITFSEQYPRGLGRTVEPLLAALGNSGEVIEKVEFSCFQNGLLRERLQELRRHGRSKVVIGGMESHVCVLQTAIDLVDNGYAAFVVVDAISSRDEASRRVALTRLVKAGVEIVNSEMMVFEWLGKAGTPKFRELLALVK
jgi:nicotinamidase-related amidase